MAVAGDLFEALRGAAEAVRAGARAPLVCVVRTARMDVDCAALFTEDGEASVVWEQPDRDVHIAARGVVAEIRGERAASRFGTLARRAEVLFEDMAVVRMDRSPMEPVLLGGFAFSEATDWALGDGRLILPELTYIRRDGRAAWIRSIVVEPRSDPVQLAGDVTRELMRLSELGGGWLPPRPIGPAQPFNPADPDYPKLVQRAIEEIARGGIAKLVPARTVEMTQKVDVVQLLATLRDRYQGCATFAFRFGDSTFVGATPELLARMRNGTVETAAVAGTGPRGETFDADHALGLALLNDPKERLEHSVVYDEIRARLVAAGVAVDEPRTPEILKLPGLQHLWTRVTGTADSRSLIDLLAHLHPTPAVAGLPVGSAVRWLEDNEAFDRGWYGGPIGYISQSGDGEFRVGLRSGLLDADTVQLFAGAGIVAGSTPDRELAETELKFQALGQAIRAAAL